MLTLVRQPATLCCAGCGTEVADVPEGVPQGWDAAFSGGQWTFLCSACQAPLSEPIFAVFRPQSSEVALFVGVGEGVRVCPLTLEEADRLHRTLGHALKIAANPGGLADRSERE